MFLAIQPSSPPLSPSRSAPFGQLLLDSSEKFGTKVNYNPFYAEDQISTFVASAYATLDSRISFFASALSNNIASVEIDNACYSLAINSDDPKTGEFIFNYETKQVTVYLNDVAVVEHSVIIYRASLNLSTRKSTNICHSKESLLERWNVTGQISISRRFRSEPTCSFQFVACKNEIDEIKSELCNGSEHTCFNYRWVVLRVQITESDKNSNNIRVSVQLGHFLTERGTPSHSPIDQPVKLQQVSGTNSYTRSRSLGQIASTTGVNYSGEVINVRTPRSSSPNETTTVRRQIFEKAIIFHGYPFFAPNGIEIRQWRSPKTHYLNENQIRSSQITFDYLGHGSIFCGEKLAVELRNIKVDLDFEEDGQPDQEGITEEWIFENCRDLFELYLPAELENGFLRQPDPNILRNPGMNHDVGGAIRKTATKIYRLNGTPVFEETIQTGYAFSSNQVYNNVTTIGGTIVIEFDTLANPVNFYGEVVKTITDWVFDSDGYLVEINISGNEKARLQQESEKLEAAVLTAQAELNQVEINSILVPDPFLIAQAQAYEFTENLPIIDQTDFTLNSFENFYNNIVQKEDCEDLTFVQAKFVREMRRSRTNYIIKQNPKSTDNFQYPPIQTGSFVRESSKISLTSTTFPERYEVRNRTQNSEGEYLKNTRSESKNEFRDGKPPIQINLNQRFDYENPGLNSNYEKYNGSNFILFSAGVVNQQLKADEGSRRYSGVDDPNVARAIAETENSIDNTQRSVTTRVNIDFRVDVDEGDFMFLRGKRWKIFDIGDDRTVNDYCSLRSDRLELLLGFYLAPPVSLENRNDCSGLGGQSTTVVIDTSPPMFRYFNYDRNSS